MKNTDIDVKLKEDIQVTSIEDKDSLQKWNLYLYGSSEVIVPGIGFALRKFNKSLGYEINISASSALFVTSAKCSIGLIQSFKDTGKGFYLGTGFGGVFIAPLGEPLKSFYMPIYLGYQDKRLFTDIGFELIYNKNKPYILPIPVKRAGWGF